MLLKKITISIAVLFIAALLYQEYKMTQIYLTDWKGNEQNVTKYVKDETYIIYKDPHLDDSYVLIKRQPIPFPHGEFNKHFDPNKSHQREIEHIELFKEIVLHNQDWQKISST